MIRLGQLGLKIERLPCDGEAHESASDKPGWEVRDAEIFEPWKITAWTVPAVAHQPPPAQPPWKEKGREKPQPRART